MTAFLFGQKVLHDISQPHMELFTESHLISVTELVYLFKGKRSLWDLFKGVKWICTKRAMINILSVRDSPADNDVMKMPRWDVSA